MRDLSITQQAYQDVDLAIKLKVANLQYVCHRQSICSCGALFCSDGVDKCTQCRLSADIVETLDLEFDIQISLEKAEEGATLFDRENLNPFYRWIAQCHPLAPLAYLPVTA